jgi:hypothetical protein
MREVEKDSTQHKKMVLPLYSYYTWKPIREAANVA